MSDEVSTVFVGDSITAGGRWFEYDIKYRLRQ